VCGQRPHAAPHSAPTPTYAARLSDAQAVGANEQQRRAIAVEGLHEIHFKDRGRAHDLEVEFTDIDYIELGF